MIVLPKKASSPKGETPKQPAETYSFPAPIRGWVLSESRYSPLPGSARVLDNFICTNAGIRPRGGKLKYATIGDPVTALFPYSGTTGEMKFAATATDIYDITTVADPDVAPTADVSGQTGGDYSVIQFGNAGGQYLYAVNGADSAQLFDGTTWTTVTGVSTPAITGVTTADLSQTWVYANRIWFVEGGTRSAWYLPVDAIAGAAIEFSLEGIFRKGGTLLFGASWSQDAGDGLDDKCVFVTTEGEVAVYQGTDPSSGFTKVGLYEMPRPLGKNAWVRAGGNLLVMTDVGLIPISAAIDTDIAAMEQQALSLSISAYWQRKASTIISRTWQGIKVPVSGYLVVTQPESVDDGTMLVVNLQTKAWSRITGWQAESVGVFEGYGYFGSADGNVYLMESGGSDNGTPYTCSYIGAHEPMGRPGQQKAIRQVRMLLANSSPSRALIGAVADFSETLPSPPNSPSDYTEGSWDVAEWDVDLWDAETTFTEDALWRSAAAVGSMIAPYVMMTFGISPTPNIEIVGIDAQYVIGGVVT